MENTTNISIPMIPLEPAINTAEIKAETLINLISYFYTLFKDKNVPDRFETFMNDCTKQAINKFSINELLIFKDLEVPDSDFDSGMGVIPNEPTITENENTIPETDSQNERTNKEDSTTQELDTESEVLPPDTEAEKDKDKAQGSDIIVDIETELKPV